MSTDKVLAVAHRVIEQNKELLRNLADSDTALRLLILSDLHLEFRAPQPNYVCEPCGVRYGQQAWPWAPPVRFQPGRCGVCFQETNVASPVECGDLGNDWNLDLPAADKYDIVILAGDIHTQGRAIAWAAKTFPDKEIIYVVGNHEFYGAHINKMMMQLHEEAKAFPNIYLLDNNSAVIGGVRFIGCTLWTDFKLHGDSMESIGRCMHDAADCMLDFRAITFGSTGWMRPGDSVKLHLVSLQYLRDELAKPFDGKTVVVTHHLPSMRSVATRFEKDILSAAFASNLDDLIAQVDGLWIHGHTHDSFDYNVDRCRVLCNPRGYPQSSSIKSSYENAAFRSDLIVEVMP